jgi:two-component system, sensor histidine kinase PdtaS
MLNKITTIFIFFLLQLSVLADNYIDSLINLLNKTKEFKTQIELLNEISWEISTSNPEAALNYAIIAKELAEANKQPELLATAFNRIGLAYDIMGKYDSAVYNYQIAFNKRIELRDSIGASNTLLNIGAAYYTQGFYNLALKNYLLCSQLIKLNGQHKNENTLAKALNNIGLIYRVKKDYKQAISTYNESLNIKRNTKDFKGEFNSYTNLALAWQNLGDYTIALNYNDSAHALIEANNMEIEIAGNLINRAGILKDVNRIDEALKTLSEAEQWLKQFPDEHTEVFLYSLKGEIFTIQNKTKEALTELEKCLTLSIQLGRRELTQATYLALSQLQEKSQNFTLSLYFFKLHKQLSDSIFSIENQRYINELQAIYETKKNEEKINILNLENDRKDLQLKQKNLIIILGSISVVFALIVIVLLIYFLKINRRKKLLLLEKNKVIEQTLSEKNVLLREIHHRVKNNLQIITGLLEIQESLHNNDSVSTLINEAQGRIKTMSIIHELLYQTETIAQIPFETYLVKLVNSIEANFSSKCHSVQKTFNIEPITFNIDTIIPIGLILNELINNSFKYVFTKQEENMLGISLSQTGDFYVISVSDNGSIPLHAPFENEKNSFGLKLVKMLARQLKGDISYEYKKGSNFILTFKNALES